MTLENLDQFIVDMRNGGRNRKKDYVRSMVSEWPESEWEAGLRFLSGQYTSAGIGKQSAIDAVEMYDLVDDFEARVQAEGTVTEALRENDVADVHVDTFVQRLTPTDPDSLAQLQTWIEDILSNESGDDQIATLGRMLMDFEEPHIVTFALLDDWQTGVTETTIANALGEQVGASKADIQRARALEPDPVAYARACAEDRFGDLLEPEAGKPFKAMKAKSEQNLDALMSFDSPKYTEPKLDGYRMLVHVQSGDATAYTRRLKDATASLPELERIDWPDGEWIFDGEAMASDGSYTTTSEMVGSNQERDLDDRDEHVTFHAFDLLLDGDMGDQTERRYEKRRAGLVLTDTRIDSPYFDLVRAFGFKEHADPVAEGLEYAEEHDFEGIIVKDGSSTYQFGKRSKYWVKKKLTEVTVDLVMAEFEEGESESTVGTLGGMRLETADGRYVGNVGNGVSDELRDEIWQNRDHYRGETVEITFEGLGTNDELRFPRIDRLRVEDGEPDDFDRVQELAEQV